ncbi:phosphatidylinositol-4-phosphate 5-kinase its3 [Uncinocarpus reesii 1704]|uniref:1-phosphatidylinositol-4-phosphate 5-kinase n=1 Tax=Uncinocarpus reesii (strain UAMH 1704) TaxID=336963 RepID=C4JDR5_UNCRE|nr:phosphatidylinositol-4-phosphate 5-kinase its3 [Uncinocarpus reesii 1704]EEP75695.1 phosphatidylinositol-4-phosphate 5-kinase its3 [Uncinocarpus reesii 1704]
MPALTTTQEPQAQLRPRTTSPPPLFNHHHTPRKSHDRSSLSNAFVWASEANGEHGHVDPPSEFFMTNFKAGSFQSLPHTNKSVVSSHGRERSHSRNGSLLSVGAGSLKDKEHARHSLANGIDAQVDGPHGVGLPNGAHGLPHPVAARPVVNGDPSSTDGLSTEHTPPTTVVPSPIAEHTGLAPSRQSSQTVNRHSSPPSTLQTDLEQSTSPPSPRSPRLAHRHTLQVPRTTSGRRSVRETFAPSPSEDNLASSDRFSSVSGFRRGSLSLARRTPRSVQSDLHLDDGTPQDEEAARWTEAIKHRRASKRRRRDEEDEDRVIVGTKVDQNHVNYVTAYNMLTGIRFTVSRTNAKLDRELTDADFEAKHKFSFDITGNELTPSAKYDFKFKDYAPWVFRRLRAKFRLDPADYLMSLTSKYILSELGSPGKSGSFFYFSRDYKYIIKTIHHAEHKLLRRILRDYYEHIENNPNTLISQFYGLHRVKMAYGRKIHFVVMNNLFPPHRDIHQMFDLKGSTIGRDFREEDLVSNPRATLKDLNWLRRTRHLELGPMKRDIFLAQLRRDVALLQRLKIMDYSLLIGIHDAAKGNEEKLRDKTLQVFQPGGEGSEEQQANVLMRTPSRLENARKARELREIIKREKPIPMEQTTARMPDEILDERKNHVFYSDEGGLMSTHENGNPGEEIYYLGVIDCLTHYGMIKKMEHFWKGLSHNKTQISPIPPVAYGDRFINFVSLITKSKEEVERDLVNQENAQDQPVMDKGDIDRTADRSPAERAMDQAAKEAVKSSKTLEKQPEPRDRVLTTVRTPDGDLASSATPSTQLPVVEEVGEGSSTGGRSGQSGYQNDEPQEFAPNGILASDPRRWTFRTALTPPGPPPDRPPPPPKVDSSPSRHKGKAAMRDSPPSRDKELPMLPFDSHRSPSPNLLNPNDLRPSNVYVHPR